MKKENILSDTISKGLVNMNCPKCCKDNNYMKENKTI
jgi:hypothetical protein